MSFPHDLPAAAHRNLEAADQLECKRRRDVAGYLYGIAAECAIKALVLEAGMRVDDVLYAHFPELRTRLRDQLSGRRSRHIAVFVHDDAFMNNWHISMRYANAGQIIGAWVDRWRNQARRVVGVLGTLG